MSHKDIVNFGHEEAGRMAGTCNEATRTTRERFECLVKGCEYPAMPRWTTCVEHYGRGGSRVQFYRLMRERM